MKSNRRVYDESKTFYCKCGCGGAIELKPYHKSYGVPDYVKAGHSRKGKECSDVHKKNLSKGQRKYLEDEDNYNKRVANIKATIERQDVRDKIRQSKLGTTIPVEVRSKISLTKKNSEPTEKELIARKESGERLRKYNEENGTWNEGLTKETSESIRIGSEKAAKKNTGKKRTAEVRKLLSDLAIKRCIDDVNYSRGKFFSNKNNRLIKYDSSYEVKAFEILEELDSVKSYDRCKFYINYEYKGNTHKHNPDILVNYIDGATEIIEVKAARFILINDKTKRKIKIANEYCKSKKIRYSVWTENKLFI